MYSGLLVLCFLASVNGQAYLNQIFSGYHTVPRRGLGTVADKLPRKGTRKGPFLPNIIIPGNKKGSFPQSIPGLALPGQTQNFDRRVHFNPFTQMVDTSFRLDKDEAFGYGLGVHGLNPLNLDVSRLYPLLANSRRVQTDGQFQPWTLGFNVGSEWDLKKHRGVGGFLDIPILGLNQIFDFNGILIQKNEGSSLSQGGIDFPLLGTPFRFPLSGKWSKGGPDPQVHWAHAIPNLNLHNIPPELILAQLGNGREANPTWLGKK